MSFFANRDIHHMNSEDIEKFSHAGQIATYIIYTLTCRYRMLCRICAVQIQPRKDALDHADHTDYGSHAAT